MASSFSESIPPLHTQMIQSFHLVWLDKSINQTSDKWHNIIMKFREIVNSINTFVDVDSCFDFITDAKEAAFVIISGEFTETFIPTILGIAQLKQIYIFCENKLQHEKCLSKYPPAFAVHNDITSMYEAIENATQNYDHNAISISVVKESDGTSKQDLNKLDCRFMYTQLLKDILINLDFNQGHFQEFITYCRQRFIDNRSILNVNKFESEYNGKEAIWWYTYPSFLFAMLNRALRMMDVSLIVNMGFFLRDLHNQIAELHSQQYCGQNQSNSFVVYRGQALSQKDFHHLKATQGGLVAFNNFLSTSLDRDLALGFAASIDERSYEVRVLFVIAIDSSVSTTPFADIQKVSCFKEKEILFSMHSVFRIGSIEQIENNSHLWQVNLKLTSDSDPQLRLLKTSLENDGVDPIGWLQLAKFMLHLAQYDKAQQICNIMLNQTADETEQACIYNYLGFIKRHERNFTDAITFCEKSIEIAEKMCSANDPKLVIFYGTIISVYDDMGEYSKALLYHEKALEIGRITFSSNHPTFATLYNNIASVYRRIGEYSKALSYHEKALDIQQKALPPNHPHLAAIYSNIALVCDHMREYSKAIKYNEQALEIQQNTLPRNHPAFVVCYSNIASVYFHIHEYSKALSYHGKALEIGRKALPPNHSELATAYNNVALVYHHIHDYSKAIRYCEKALEIQQNTLPSNHPDLVTCYNNIALVYRRIGEYSKAFSYYGKALQIGRKALPPNHPDLANLYANIASLYNQTHEYSKALSYYEKALEIQQQALPRNHPDLVDSYVLVAFAHSKMEDYSKAIRYFEKALKIQENALPAIHPHLASCYISIGFAHYNIGDYSKAIRYYEKALETRQKVLPPNHPDLAICYSGIAVAYEEIGDRSKAATYFKKAEEIK